MDFGRPTPRLAMGFYGFPDVITRQGVPVMGTWVTASTSGAVPGNTTCKWFVIINSPQRHGKGIKNGAPGQPRRQV